MHDAVYSNDCASAQTESTPNLAEARNFARQHSNSLPLLSEHRNIISSAWIRHISKQQMPPRYMRVLNAIFSQTIDFQKREDDMSGLRLQQLTCIRADHANETIKDLEQDHAVIMHKGSYGQWLSINFDFASWGKNKTIPVRKYNNDPRCLLPEKYREPVDTGNLIGYNIDAASTQTNQSNPVAVSPSPPENKDTNKIKTIQITTKSNLLEAENKNTNNTDIIQITTKSKPIENPISNGNTTPDAIANTMEINTHLSKKSAEETPNTCTETHTETHTDKNTESASNEIRTDKKTESVLNQVLDKLLNLEQKMQNLAQSVQTINTQQNSDTNVKNTSDAEQYNTANNVKNSPDADNTGVNNTCETGIENHANTAKSVSSPLSNTEKNLQIPAKTQLAQMIEKLHYPADMDNNTKQKLTELLMPTGDKAQPILNLLLKRLQNTHDPVKSVSAYLSGLVKRHKKGSLELNDTSDRTAAPQAPQAPQLTQDEKDLATLKTIYQDAHLDRQHIQRNINVLRGQQSFEEYLNDRPAEQKLWYSVNQTLQNAQDALACAM